MKNIDLAYMAGMLDGEGYIGICKRKTYNNSITPCYYTLTVHLNMANKCIPELFMSHFGGSMNGGFKRKPNYKIQWRWTVTNKIAYRFLEKILPYLRLKKNEAILGMEFQKQRYKQHASIFPTPHKTEQEIILEKNQYTLMRQLKDKSEVMVNG